MTEHAPPPIDRSRGKSAPIWPGLSEYIFSARRQNLGCNHKNLYPTLRPTHRVQLFPKAMKTIRLKIQFPVKGWRSPRRERPTPKNLKPQKSPPLPNAARGWF